jgi:hypothetical protein
MAKKRELYENHERPRRRRDGRDREVHLEIIARRMDGGAPATPEAYARALEQWHQLPGSVVRPPTDLKSTQEALKPKGPSLTTPAPTEDENGKEGQP